MAGKRPATVTTRRSVIMTTKRPDSDTSASTLADLLTHDAAARTAALREQFDQQAETIREIHQNEEENQKLSKIMDEYKRRNAELRLEHGKLKGENERLRMELSSKISKKLEDLNDQMKVREKRVADQEEQLAFIETQFRKQEAYLLNGEAAFKEEVQLTKESYQQKTKELDLATKEYHQLMHQRDKAEIIPSNLAPFLRQMKELRDMADERVRQLKVKEEEGDVLRKRIAGLNQTIEKLKDEKVQLAYMFPVRLPPPPPSFHFSAPGYANRRRQSTADPPGGARPKTFYKRQI